MASEFNEGMPDAHMTLSQARQEFEMRILSAPTDERGSLDLAVFHPEDRKSIGEKIGTTVASIVFAPVTVGCWLSDRRATRRGEPTIKELLATSRERYDSMLLAKHAEIMSELKDLTEES